MVSERQVQGREKRLIVVRAMLALVMVAAAIGKASDPGPALAVLERDWEFHRTDAAAVLIGVVGAEFALAAWLIGAGRSRAALVATAAFLFAVTTSPILQLLKDSATGCGCGVVSFLGMEEPPPGLAVARNCLLGAACMFAAVAKNTIDEE